MVLFQCCIAVEFALEEFSFPLVEYFLSSIIYEDETYWDLINWASTPYFCSRTIQSRAIQLFFLTKDGIAYPNDHTVLQMVDSYWKINILLQASWTMIFHQGLPMQRMSSTTFLEQEPQTVLQLTESRTITT